MSHGGTAELRALTFRAGVSLHVRLYPLEVYFTCGCSRGLDSS